MYAKRVNPFLSHLGGEVLDTVVKTGAAAALGAAWKNRSKLIAFFKKITRGAEFQKPVTDFEALVQGSFAKVMFTEPNQDYGDDVAFYTTAGPEIAQCKYYR